jgi:hypothetical protein
MASMKKQWIVVRYGARGISGGGGLKWFDTRTDALKDMEAKCARNLGIRYVVLEVVATAVIPTRDVVVEEI